MAKIDLGKGLKKLQKSAEILKENVKEVKLPDMKEVADGVKKVADATVTGVQKTTENIKEAVQKKEKTEEVKDQSVRVLSTESAIMIIYYMMSADGEINAVEEEKFEMICSDLDPDFKDKKDALIGVCEKELEKGIDEGDRYDVLQDAVEKAILESKPTADSYITPKLLIWNLLSIAYSDDLYHEDERRLIKYIVRKMDVDKAVFLEMESSMETAIDINKEMDWIKTQDRPYLQIEAVVKELEHRQNVIFESALDLIRL